MSLQCKPAISGATNNWLQLQPGIEYQDLNANSLSHWSHIHAFRINLAMNQLELKSANDSHPQPTSIDVFAHQSNALIALNGGFFDEKYRPLGLRISHHQQINSLKSISWWGIFYTKNGHPKIVSLHQYTPNPQIEFAVQAGPRLIINGQIPALKAGFAERSALGITNQGEVIILVTENMPMTTTALAQWMKSSPLNCSNALNLDGGSSSQLYAHIGSFKIDVPNFAQVADAIIVKAR